MDRWGLPLQRTGSRCRHTYTSRRPNASFVSDSSLCRKSGFRERLMSEAPVSEKANPPQACAFYEEEIAAAPLDEKPVRFVVRVLVVNVRVEFARSSVPRAGSGPAPALPPG